MHLSLIWWNTGLSPTIRTRDKSRPEEQEVAASMIKALTRTAPVDFIGLCEVSPEDIGNIEAACHAEGYGIHQATDAAGRSAFDMCAIYRRDKIAVLEAKNILLARGERTIRVGHRVTLAVAGATQPLYAFLSHWPSRLNLAQFDAVRESLGTTLRSAIEGLRESDPNANVILLGDYNDEPFDDAIATNLMATRDRNMAARRPHLFYNPFWRHLSSFTAPDAEPMCDPGSYFHRGGDSTQWRTFDQIMFSSSFLTNGEWQLIERHTRVLDIPHYTEIVKAGKTCFDHLPIVGHIEKRST